VGTIYSSQSAFGGRNIHRVKPGTCIPSDTTLQYWTQSGKEMPEGVDFDSTAGLLKTGKGTCGSWSRFFIDVLRCQGIDSTLISVYPTPYGIPPTVIAQELDREYQTGENHGTYIPSANQEALGFVIKDWTIDPGRLIRHSTDEVGVAGQGMNVETDPQSYFTNHALVIHGGLYYDPSYAYSPSVPPNPPGSVAYGSLAAWEYDSIAGYTRFLGGNYINPDPTKNRGPIKEQYLWKAPVAGESHVGEGPRPTY